MMAMKSDTRNPLLEKSEYKEATEIELSFKNQGYKQFDTCSCLTVDSVIKEEEEERMESRKQK